MARGNGGNRLRCLLEVSGLLQGSNVNQFIAQSYGEATDCPSLVLVSFQKILYQGESHKFAKWPRFVKYKSLPDCLGIPGKRNVTVKYC